MVKTKPKKSRISVSLFELQKKALQQIADRNDVSLARVIQEAVKAFLQTHADGKDFLFQKTDSAK